MATVRLHTQHHPAGDLRPATPTCCCCCSCCCVGATIGTFAVLPVMIARAVADRRPEPGYVPKSLADDIADDQPVVVRPTPGRRLGPRGEGFAAIGVALLPFLLLLLVGPELELGLLMIAAGALALMVWAALRARQTDRPAWPPVVSVLVVAPLAFGIEFYVGVGLVSENSSAYLLFATLVCAIVFGLGLLFLTIARRQ